MLRLLLSLKRSGFTYSCQVTHNFAGVKAAARLGMTTNTSGAQPAFQALVPLLDEALLSLREKDRTALLL
jgi:hypothetical protein